MTIDDIVLNQGYRLRHLRKGWLVGTITYIDDDREWADITATIPQEITLRSSGADPTIDVGEILRFRLSLIDKVEPL